MKLKSCDDTDFELEYSFSICDRIRLSCIQPVGLRFNIIVLNICTRQNLTFRNETNVGRKQRFAHSLRAFVGTKHDLFHITVEVWFVDR